MNSSNEVYNRLIEPIKESMKRGIIRIVQDPDDAADAFQDALYKVWINLDRILNHPNPKAYILSICMSSAYDLLRKKARIGTNEVCLESGFDFISVEHEPLSFKQELVATIQQALSALPLKQAQAVFLRLFENESYATIATCLGCREQTARSHVSKGLAYLRTILDKNDLLQVRT